MVSPEAIAAVLGLKARIHNLRELDSAVSAGLPKRSLEGILLRFPNESSTKGGWESTASGEEELLSPEDSEKAERLARVIATAEYVWNNHDQAHEWLGAPHRELDGTSPLETARTELGARRVEELLEKLFFGLPV